MGCAQSQEQYTSPVTKAASSAVEEEEVEKASTATSTSRTTPSGWSSAAAERQASAASAATPAPAGDRSREGRGHASPEADLPINWNLRFSDLVVSEHIANGGYCTVLACVLNGEKRAVKIPLANCHDPDGAVADLMNEIKILKRLRHPHLCSVYGAGGWRKRGDVPFLVLERLQYRNLAQQCGTDVDDTSMRAHMRQRKIRAEFPFRKRLDFGLQLVEVIKYLHSDSVPGGFIVHRDLKPSNIGISDDGFLKVFDFGLARIREQRDPFTDRYVMTGQTGSQRFMAPEVFDGMPYNEKADIFSYGIVLWELCALLKPFAGMSSHQHAKKVFRGGLRPPLDKRWPEGLRRLMQRCWDTEPNLRPEAREAVQMLSDVIEEVDASGNAVFEKL